MTRRRILIVLGSVAAVVAVLGGVIAALRHTPAFYAESLRDDVSTEVREQQSKKFVQLATQLEGSIVRDNRWSGEFTQDQINGFLAYDLPERFSSWLPQRVVNPRIRLSAGAIDLAFHYQQGWWTGTVHVQVRPYILGPNQLGLDVRTVRAGAVPIPMAKPLDEIVREMRKSGWIVQWRPTKSGELLVIDLQPEIAAKLSLDGVELHEGVLRFAGHRPSPEVTAARAASANSPATAAKTTRPRR